MSEHSKKEKGKKKERPSFGIDFGVGNFLEGLGGLVEQLSELAEKGGALSRSGELPMGKEFKGVYGFNVRVGGLGKEREIKLEPFGNIRRGEKGTAVVEESREPLVDVFDEEAYVLVVAEMPGVEEKNLRLGLKGDILEIHAEAGDRRYHKEVLLPSSFTEDRMSHTYKSGLLEIRFQKK